MYHKGKVVKIFTPHINCEKMRLDPTLNDEYILHPVLDFALDTRCGSGVAALNATSYATPHLGDDLVVYGFGLTAFVWQGILSKIVDDSDGICSAAAH